MIEIRNIYHSFDGKEVLSGISGIFRKKTINMIIGASGTGKSVLLKSIIGLIKPDKGEVLYDKRNFYIASKETRIQIRREIGMLFQGGALFDSKNVEQNVIFPLDILTKKSRKEKLDRVNICLKRVGLENINQKMPSELSGGMKKRVGIARAIAINSRYLFCDEPNSGLDPQTAIIIDNLIQEITKEYNLTTVVVSHDMNSVIEMGEHIMFIHKGKLCWKGTNKDIYHSNSSELNSFIFSNRLMRKMQRYSS